MLKLGKFNDGRLLKVNENKPEFASIMVVGEEGKTEIRDGFLNTKGPKLAFITGRKAELESFIEGKAAEDKVFGDSAKIITVEREGYAPGFTPKCNPSTAEEREEMKVLKSEAGNVIYSRNEVDLSGEKEDQLISGSTSTTTYAEAVELSRAEVSQTEEVDSMK